METSGFCLPFPDRCFITLAKGRQIQLHTGQIHQFFHRQSIQPSTGDWAWLRKDLKDWKLTIRGLDSMDGSDMNGFHSRRELLRREYSRRLRSHGETTIARFIPALLRAVYTRFVSPTISSI